jgi:hypothetical protein
MVFVLFKEKEQNEKEIGMIRFQNVNEIVYCVITVSFFY